MDVEVCALVGAPPARQPSIVVWLVLRLVLVVGLAEGKFICTSSISPSYLPLSPPPPRTLRSICPPSSSSHYTNIICSTRTYPLLLLWLVSFCFYYGGGAWSVIYGLLAGSTATSTTTTTTRHAEVVYLAARFSPARADSKRGGFGGRPASFLAAGRIGPPSSILFSLSLSPERRCCQ